MPGCASGRRRRIPSAQHGVGILGCPPAVARIHDGIVRSAAHPCSAASHTALQDGGDCIADCAPVFPCDGIARSVCAAGRRQWARLLWDRVTGGARIAGCSAVGRSPTATAPRNVPRNGVAVAPSFSVRRLCRGTECVSVPGPARCRDAAGRPRPRAAPVTASRAAPQISVSRRVSTRGAAIARDAQASWGSVALLVLRTPTGGVAGTPRKAQACPTRPVDVIHHAAAAVTRVAGRGRRGVDVRSRKRVAAGVYLYCTNSSVLETINLAFISGSAAIVGTKLQEWRTTQADVRPKYISLGVSA